MLALYRKELRGLFPMLVLSMFLVSGDLISRPITERLDEDTFSDVAGLMPGDARQQTAVGPAAVAVHNDGDVRRQALRIDGQG